MQTFSMHLTTWIAFVLAYAAMAITPGPVTLMIMSYALTSGRRTALSVVAGTILGDATCCVLASIGLGALIAASAAAFMVLKIAGAAYLIFLGVRMWRAAAIPAIAASAAQQHSALRMFGHAYLTTIINPKTVLFFTLFLPQFLDAGKSLLPQLAILLPTIFVVGGIVDVGYSFSASFLRGFLRTPKAQARVGKACGGLLVGEGVAAMGAHLVA